MITCPYCRRPAMTTWQKLRIGPRHRIACASCGKKVAVSKAAILAVAVPITIGAFLAHISTSPLLGTAALFIAGAVALWVYVSVVPIVGRDA